MTLEAALHATCWYSLPFPSQLTSVKKADSATKRADRTAAMMVCTKWPPAHIMARWSGTLANPFPLAALLPRAHRRSTRSPVPSRRGSPWGRGTRSRSTVLVNGGHSCVHAGTPRGSDSSLTSRYNSGMNSTDALKWPMMPSTRSGHSDCAHARKQERGIRHIPIRVHLGGHAKSCAVVAILP